MFKLKREASGQWIVSIKGSRAYCDSLYHAFEIIEFISLRV